MGNGQTRMLRALWPSVNRLLIEATAGRTFHEETGRCLPWR